MMILKLPSRYKLAFAKLECRACHTISFYKLFLVEKDFLEHLSFPFLIYFDDFLVLLWVVVCCKSQSHALDPSLKKSTGMKNFGHQIDFY